MNDIATIITYNGDIIVFRHVCAIVVKDGGIFAHTIDGVKHQILPQGFYGKDPENQLFSVMFDIKQRYGGDIDIPAIVKSVKIYADLTPKQKADRLAELNKKLSGYRVLS